MEGECLRVSYLDRSQQIFYGGLGPKATEI